MNKVNVTMWDVGGGCKIKMLWRHYYQNTQLVIFVIDSTDKDRIDEAKEEVHKLMSEEELIDAPLLIFANKQDSNGCMSVAEITEKLDLHKLKKREWFIQGSSGLTGYGLQEGLNWGVEKFLQKKSKK